MRRDAAAVIGLLLGAASVGLALLQLHVIAW
jgi:hypothetical protein